MAINAEAPFVSVQVWPVGSTPTAHSRWTLSESYTGFFQPTGSGPQNTEESTVSFESLQLKSQPAFSYIDGPMNFIRFKLDGLIEYGISAALKADPDTELCGITALLNNQAQQNRMQQESKGVLAPNSPKDSPVLLWQSVRGSSWETVMPARSPYRTAVRHANVLADTEFSIKTADLHGANQGFEAIIDMGGIAPDQNRVPFVRLTWGDKWALVIGKYSTRPYIEKKVSQNEWEICQILEECPPIDIEFWKSTHTIHVFRLGGRLCIQFNALAFWLVEYQVQGKESKVVPATWKRAPLRFSVFGVDCALAIGRFVGHTTEKDSRGKFRPITLSFERKVPAPSATPDTISFSAHGEGNTGGSDPNSLQARLQGLNLDQIVVEGKWAGAEATYTATLQCSQVESPLLSALVVAFPRRTTTASNTPIEVRSALTSLSVDSGDPETLPDAEASFSLSYPLLEQLVPNWRQAIQPYRPVLIRAKYPPNPQNPEDEEWTTLFRGFLTPDSVNRSGWNARELPLVARGPLVRLSQPAALVDERFGPLDVQLNAERHQLWGAEAAKNLLTDELGEGWTDNFNGDGNAFRFLPASHYPLLDNGNGTGFFMATGAPQSGSWHLPPPYGSDLKTWLDTLAQYDYAVWFFDAASDAFFYGRILNFLAERGHTIWTVPESSPPPTVTTTRDWPLLSSLSKSGLLEKAYNEVRVWGQADQAAAQLQPTFVMGRAGDSGTNSLDPLSIAQSWRRTLLIKPDFLKMGLGFTGGAKDYADDLAYNTWKMFEGRPPARMDVEFETGFLGPRWGEILHLPTGFEGPHGNGVAEDWRILQVKHQFNFAGDQNRFSTTLTTRTLSKMGQ